jgi:hypothetical protein
MAYNRTEKQKKNKKEKEEEEEEEKKKRKKRKGYVMKRTLQDENSKDLACNPEYSLTCRVDD